MLFGFKGFERLGQLLIYAASGTIAMVFLGMMFLEASRETWEQFWFLQRRSIYIGRTLFTVFLVVFGLYFHLKIPRNVKTLFGTFGMLFGSVAMTLIVARSDRERAKTRDGRLEPVVHRVRRGHVFAGR